MAAATVELGTTYLVGLVGLTQIVDWSAVFEGVPDFRSELVRAAVDGEIVWSEWRWRGTQSDGALLDMAGVMVCGVHDGRMAWARLYMEPVEQAGAGIEPSRG